MSTSYQTIDVRPVTGAIGAEIHGVNLSGSLGNHQFSEIRAAFHEFGVIFFRDQTLTPEQHIAFAQRWGEINVNRFFEAVEGYPQIAQVRKEPDQKLNIGSKWHTDHSYDEAPAMGSILYALEVPEVGGDTLFASMYAAYDALSDGMKKFLGTLKARHSSRHVFGQSAYTDGQRLDGRVRNPEEAVQDAVHDLIITHPGSGRKALYVNPQFTVGIDGWSDEESQALLGYLYEHGTRAEFTCRFRWKRGSIAFWDNRATWHKALNDYQGQRRHLHRITIEGSALN